MKGEQRKGKRVCFLGEGKGRKFRRGKRKGSTCDYRNGGDGEEDGDCVPVTAMVMLNLDKHTCPCGER